MRKIYFTIVITGILIVLAAPLKAQVHFNLNVNLSNQPVWGPTGYDYVDNYYLPDIEVYYNVPLHRYYYNERGRWINSLSLPPRFRNYDLYNSYKVVVNEREPWRNHENYRQKYSSFKGRHDQQPIRDSRDSKYFVNKNHPEHNNWVQQQKHDNGNHNGLNKGNNGNGNGNVNRIGNDKGNVNRIGNVKGNGNKQNKNQDKHDNGKGKK